jgi:hypothetical protein
MRLPGRIAVIGLVLLSGSCRDSARIRIEPGSTPLALTFSLVDGDEPARIAAFRLDRCDARGSPAPESHWLALAPDTAELISRISYGNNPPGWRSVQGPQPIVAGCYRAAIARAAPLEFDVLRNGQVKARPQR